MAILQGMHIDLNYMANADKIVLDYIMNPLAIKPLKKQARKKPHGIG